MYQFFESIKLAKGKFYHLELHAERMNATRKQFFANVKPINLKSILPSVENLPDGLFKVKVTYAKDILGVEINPYQAQKHQKVVLIEDNLISYKFKSVAREKFENFKKQSDADDAIFIKNGLLTDASYSNIILMKENQWFSPKSCLLEGIKRKVLVQNKKIVLADIEMGNLGSFEKIGFINAMRDFEMIYSFTQHNDLLILNSNE